MSKRISRRTVLRGFSASLALPALEAMGPLRAWASPAEPSAPRIANRMAILYVPNGIHMADWTPTTAGPLGELPRTLAPLEPFKDQLNVLTGLTADKARAHGDGGGDHARAMAAFLTGVHPRKTDGADIRVGVSADQVAASRIGAQTRLASLEIGADASALAGNCDSGYSCAYSSSISWRSATTPVPKLNDPRLIFERLFGSGAARDQAQREVARRSILDFVREDALALAPRLSGSDRRKLDEYFAAVRDIEQRLERAAQLPQPPRPEMQRPTAIPRDYQEHLRLLCDLLIVAFQADITRVCTFVFANEGSNRPYPSINISEGHHELSHHANDRAKQAKIAQINRFHVTQLAYLLERLQGIREGEGTLLDHCMIAYGSGNSDGNRHNHDDLPILMAGKGGNSLQTGRHIRYARETPLNNLWLAMLDRMGASVETLGDSTGRLGQLT